MLKNLQRIFEIELFVDNTRGIHLNSVKRELSLLFIQEPTFCCRIWQIQISENGESDGAATFDKEKISPIGKGSCMDLKNTECE
jgi:hypothetical protein